MYNSERLSADELVRLLTLNPDAARLYADAVVAADEAASKLRDSARNARVMLKPATSLADIKRMLQKEQRATARRSNLTDLITETRRTKPDGDSK